MENNTRRLTDTVARSIKPPAAKVDAETREINGKTVRLGHLAREYHWCKDTPGFGLLVSSSGTKTWVSARRVKGKKVWRVLGKVQGANSISAEAARKLFQVINNELSSGIDRVEENRQQKITDASNTITVAEVWSVYLEERKPRWGGRHYADHISLSVAGGEKFKRGTGTTQPGPLYKFMNLPLRDLTAPAIELWAEPERARLAQRLHALHGAALKRFLIGAVNSQPMPSCYPPRTQLKPEKHVRNSENPALSRTRFCVNNYLLGLAP